MNIACRALACCCMLLAGFFEESNAQEVHLWTIRTYWPVVEAEGNVLYFSWLSGMTGLRAQDFRVYEDDREITQFQFTSEYIPPNYDCYHLLLDRSDSMAASFAQAKVSANALIENFRSSMDHGAVFSYNTQVTFDRLLTEAFDSLRMTVDGLSSGGDAKLLDGIYDAISGLSLSTCVMRPLYVFTRGHDEGSVHTVAEVIALAQLKGVQIYVASYTPVVNASTLDSLAARTGGRRVTDPGEYMHQLYIDTKYVTERALDYTISYNTFCPDGTERRLTVIFNPSPGWSDTTSRTFRTWKSHIEDVPVSFGLDSAGAVEGTTVRLALRLRDTIPDGYKVFPATFGLRYNTARLQLRTVDFPAGCLLDSSAVRVTALPDGVDFRIVPSPTLHGPGPLFWFTFRLTDVSDTTAIRLDLVDWLFEAGCLGPVLGSGEVVILPKQPLIGNSALAIPDSLYWDHRIKDFSDNPFLAKVTCLNTGTDALTNVRYRLFVDTSQIAFFSAGDTLKSNVPPAIAPGGGGQASWLLRATPRMTGAQAIVRLSIQADNHPTVELSDSVYIPPMGPVLQCSASAQAVFRDTSAPAYVPMPFAVDATLSNSGWSPTDTVWCELLLPAHSQLALAGTSTALQAAQPPLVETGSHATARWQFSHPVVFEEVRDTVRILFRAANADSAECRVVIAIPAMIDPQLSVRCGVSSRLNFNPAAGTYDGNPFDVTLEAMNNSVSPSLSSTARLILPPDVELVDSSVTPLLQSFQPSALIKYTGGTWPRVVWKVRYISVPTADTACTFRFLMTGERMDGKALDTLESLCRMEVQGVPHSFAVSCASADSIRMKADGSGLEVNPFPVRFKVTNPGAVPVVLAQVSIAFPSGSDPRLDPSTPQVRALAQQLLPGDSLFVVWLFHTAAALPARSFEFTMTAVDDSGRTLSCRRDVFIEGARTGFVGCVALTDTVLRFDRAAQDYINKTVTAFSNLRNTGNLAADSVLVTLDISDPSGLDLVELDTGIPGAANPVLLTGYLPNMLQVATWPLRLKNRNTSGVEQAVTFRARYRVPGGADTDLECERTLHIEPAIPPPVSVESRARPDFALLQNYPNPFNPATTFEFNLPQACAARLSIRNLLGAEVAVVWNGRLEAGQHRMRFDASSLPGGVYIYRLSAGDNTAVRRMTLVK